MATMPARTALGSVGHSLTTQAKSESTRVSRAKVWAVIHKRNLMHLVARPGRPERLPFRVRSDGWDSQYRRPEAPA
jgi:hypothetical protein